MSLQVASIVLPLAETGEEVPSVLSVPMDIFILGLVAFFMVLLVLGKLALPAIAKVLEERTDAIEGGIARAAKAEAAAKEMQAKYQKQLEGARDEAGQIRAKAEADAKDIVSEARTKAEQERAAIAQRAEAQLAAERSQTITSLRQDVGGIAVDLAGKIVGASLTDDARANAVVDDFIRGLEEAADSQSAVLGEDA